jgi:fused signal recognition particle receptor
MALFKNFNFDKLKEGLTKTRDKIVNKITEVVTGKAVIDVSTLEEIEEILLSSDIGYDTTERIIEEARRRLKSEKDRSSINMIEIIKNELSITLASADKNINTEIEKYKPYVILVVGVNGVGKTTTIGKLAHNFKQSGLNVIVGAADTFRAAANEQLDIWAKRAGVQIVDKGMNTDPSSVAFDTVKQAVDEKADVVLIDTAGRLHNKANLMEELKKIKRVIGKIVPNAPNDVFLVLDGNNGQNAILQAEEFAKTTDITGLIITKLDGTAKGGVVFQISKKLNVPVKYIGVGEGITDLQDFDPDMFVSALFEK